MGFIRLFIRELALALAPVAADVVWKEYKTRRFPKAPKQKARKNRRRKRRGA